MSGCSTATTCAASCSKGGTILGTSRKDPYVHGEGFASVSRTLERNDIDTLVVVGGDGTLRTALRLERTAPR